MTYRRTRTALAKGCALGSFALAALTAACVAELPTAAEIQAIDVAAAEEAGTKVALLDDGHGNTVYTLDGVVVTRADALALASEKIASVGVVKARTPGGPAQIAIVSRMAGETVPMSVDTVAVGYGTGVRIRGVARVPESVGEGTMSRVRGVNPQGPEPVYLVDGVRQAGPPFGGLAPLAIESIHVIKDRDEAVKLAGPDAVNGLIVIRTKGGKPDGLELEAVPQPVNVRIRESAARTPAGPPPVYFIDGVRSSEAAFHALDPQRIESINVFKGAMAVDRIGADGANGVVEIRTRSGSR